MKIKNSKINGFSLLEAVVSLFVLTIGLLGMSGLQTKMIQVNHHSVALTQATIAAHDLIERMRANPAALRSGDYNLPDAIQHTSCFTTSGCTPNELAENDMYEWRNGNASSSIANTLPNGSGTVCIDSTPDDGTAARDESLASDGDDSTSPNDPAACDGVGEVFAVKVWWSGPDNGENPRYVTTVTF